MTPDLQAKLRELAREALNHDITLETGEVVRGIASGRWLKEQAEAIYRAIEAGIDLARQEPSPLQEERDGLKLECLHQQKRAEAAEAELAAEHETSRNDPAEQRAERYAMEAVDLTRRLAEAQAAQRDQEWQPIATAPMDGTPVELMWHGTTVTATGRWTTPDRAADEWRDVAGNDVLTNPTHWRAALRSQGAQ